MKEKIYIVTVTWPHSNAKPLRLTYRDPDKALVAIGLHAKSGIGAGGDLENHRDTTVELMVLEVLNG